MNSKQLKCVGVGLVCGIAFLCLALAEEKVAPESAKQLPYCIVKEQRLVLSDGSAILLDHLAYYRIPSEYFERGRHRTSTHHVGRIALPRKCNLPNGLVLKPGWYGVFVEFQPGADKLLFLRTDGIECLHGLDVTCRFGRLEAKGETGPHLSRCLYNML